jgi:dipeptidase E
MKLIFAMGGGGFAMEPENLVLDRYILSLAEKVKPKICFIPTASGDAPIYIENFYKAYNTLDCLPTHLSLFKPPTPDLESFVMAQDVFHIGGGNTKNLLALWRDWSLDTFLKQAYDVGKPMTGISAGMLCWFEQAVTDSFGAKLDRLDCLGWIKGSACPHFDGEAERRPTYLNLIKTGRVKGGIALDDGVGALFVDGELSKTVSSRKSANGYLFASESAKETVLRPSYLGFS